MAEKEYEIGYLKRKLEEEASVSSVVTGNGGDAAAASKIVDLAKKVRELTATVESERTKNKQLSKNCSDLELRIENMRSRSAGRTGGETNADADQNDVVSEESERRVNLQKENRELKDKLTQISHKMMEFKSQCEILKQDLKKTQKVRNLHLILFGNKLSQMKS